MTQEADGYRKHLFRARADFYRRQKTGHRQSLGGYRERIGGAGSDRREQLNRTIASQGCFLLALRGNAGRSRYSIPLFQPVAS